MSNASLFGLDLVDLPNPNTGWINVLEQELYPVYGNGINDDTAAVQAIIFANPGKTIYFPTGRYKKTAAWVVYTDSTVIQGDGTNCSVIIEASGGTDVLHFYSLLKDTAARFVNNCGVRSISFSNSVPATTGAIRVTQCNQFRWHDVTTNDIPEGVIVEGGQLSKWQQFSLNCSGAFYDRHADSTSALLTFTEATLDAGLFQPCFTQKVSQFDMAGSNKVYSLININNVDALEIGLGTMGGGYWGNFYFNSTRNGGYIASVHVTNVHNDCKNNVTGSNFGVVIGPDSNTLFKMYDITFSDGFCGNSVQGFLIMRRPVQFLKINAMQFANINTWVMDCEGTIVGQSNVIFSDCQVNGTGLLASGEGTFRGKDLASFTYSDNQVRGDTGAAASILLSGTFGTGVISDNQHAGNAADMSIGAASFSGALIVSGNSGTDTSPGSSFMGTSFGNTVNSDTARLDYYQEGTITPTLNFATPATGITYATQTGSYRRVGNRVDFDIEVAISSKGSGGSGIISVDGLPYVNAGGHSVPVALSATGLTAGVGVSYMAAKVLSTTTKVEIFQINGAGVEVALLDTDISTGGHFFFSGSYRAA